MTFLRAAAASLLVAILQLVAGVALFRFRVTHRYTYTPDLIIFYLPAFAAFVAQGLVWLALWRGRPERHAIAIAGAVSLVTFLVTLTICFNVYGT